MHYLGKYYLIFCRSTRGTLQLYKIGYNHHPDYPNSWHKGHPDARASLKHCVHGEYNKERPELGLMCGDFTAVIYMTKPPTQRGHNGQERLYLKCRADGVPDNVKVVWHSHPDHPEYSTEEV